jgi:hypothetical protein
MTLKKATRRPPIKMSEKRTGEKAATSALSAARARPAAGTAFKRPR